MGLQEKLEDLKKKKTEENGEEEDVEDDEEEVEGEEEEEEEDLPEGEGLLHFWLFGKLFTYVYFLPGLCLVLVVKQPTNSWVVSVQLPFHFNKTR